MIEANALPQCQTSKMEHEVRLERKEMSMIRWIGKNNGADRPSHAAVSQQ